MAQAEPLELFVDADYSINHSAAGAIELGFRTALAEVGHRVGGHDLVLVPMDHRGNVKRSKRNLQQYLKSGTALAIVGGLHSPPYLSHREFINDNRILTLLPWSAAGPITRAQPGSENWIFRLSVDDFQSGGFLVREAVDRQGCENVALVLLDTGWGRANFGTLTAALAERGMEPTQTEYFSSAIGSASALSLAETIARSKPDCAIMLANWDNGAQVINALYERLPSLRLFSHWGIMGGRFTEVVPRETRDSMQIRVLQTCILRREHEGSPILKAALAAGAPDVASVAEIGAPTGFVHGYDLARVLLAAVEQASKTDAWSGDILAKRAAVHAALENLETPVEGILDRYAPPFSPYSELAPNAHEALGFDDLCMARFRPDGFLEHAE
ncbi:Branched-chain amino acid ABC transporter, amino acid-binding protein [Candidatus Rhodobacter oscarellae]|uniref:Branched-chain amino acid ABC transporter, amino acid-binding protein n=1 Tax=Candidatus Rhodobacter oscarellae TaxID=1675527 RepID=A0A0J9E391_9RHOB|nr:Branched-chain amino acid ABC transporter, amino acid-binding protein [Candidatus Rhodobacter lobularis]